MIAKSFSNWHAGVLQCWLIFNFHETTIAFRFLNQIGTSCIIDLKLQRVLMRLDDALFIILVCLNFWNVSNCFDLIAVSTNSMVQVLQYHDFFLDKCLRECLLLSPVLLKVCYIITLLVYHECRLEVLSSNISFLFSKSFLTVRSIYVGMRVSCSTNSYNLFNMLIYNFVPELTI